MEGRFAESKYFAKEQRENQNDIGYLLSACAERFNRSGGQKNSQKRILHILRKKNVIPQKVLQEILQIKPGSLSELLAKMEDRNYIERYRDETDKRKVMVRITEEGIAYSKEMHARYHGDRKFYALNDEEKETLRTLLKKLLAETETDSHFQA